MNAANLVIKAILISATFLSFLGCIPVKGKVFSFNIDSERLSKINVICYGLLDIGFKNTECKFSGVDSGYWQYLPVFELSEDSKVRVEVRCKLTSVIFPR